MIMMHPQKLDISGRPVAKKASKNPRIRARDWLFLAEFKAFFASKYMKIQSFRHPK